MRIEATGVDMSSSVSRPHWTRRQNHRLGACSLEEEKEITLMISLQNGLAKQMWPTLPNHGIPGIAVCAQIVNWKVAQVHSPHINYSTERNALHVSIDVW